MVDGVKLLSRSLAHFRTIEYLIQVCDLKGLQEWSKSLLLQKVDNGACWGNHDVINDVHEAIGCQNINFG